MKRFITTILAAFILLPAYARIFPELGVDVRPVYVFSSYRDDVLRNMLPPGEAYKTIGGASLHLKYGFKFSSATKEGRLFPGAWQGIGSSVNLFGNMKAIGVPVCIYLFQGAPVWKISSSLSIYYEWNFGVSFGWKTCDGHVATSNLITGSKMNAYINLGGGLRWTFPHNWAITAGLDLTHFSNGNTSFPNPGMNMAGIRIGVVHSFGHESSSTIKSTSLNNHSTGETDDNFPDLTTVSDARQSRLPGLDITLYGAWRKRVYRGGEKPVLLNGHFPIAGLDISPMWKVTKNFRSGPSLDLQWDESSNLRKNHAYGTTADDLHFYRPSFFSQVSCGLSARAELVMPIFSLNVGIGYNIIGPEESRATYQLANLKIRLPKGFFLNIGYQLLDFSRQNNLMLGLGYSLNP